MAVRRPLQVEQELLEAFVHSGRVTEYLVAALPARLWRATPPGGRGRSIAAIVAHMQSLRRGFARFGGARPGAPTLDRRTITQAQALRAMRQSTDDLAGLFAAAIAGGRARVPGMPRRVVDMLVYLLEHDAHHRGQVAMLAADLGHRFSREDVMRMWGWKKLPEPRRG